MRTFYLFLLLFFTYSFSGLKAQTLVIGAVPQDMTNLVVNANSFYTEYNIDLDCDGYNDIACYGSCTFFQNIEKTACDPVIYLLDTNIFIYTDPQFTAPLFFNMGDTVTGSLSKTINNNTYYLFNDMQQPRYLCFAKMLPDSSYIKYWLKIQTTQSAGFDIFEILKPSVHDTTFISRMICTGSDFEFPNGDALQNIQTDTQQISYLMSAGTCDSTVITQLHVLPAQISINQNVSVCAGYSYEFPDGVTINNMSTNQTYCSNFISAGGCDSLIITNVTIMPNHNISVDVNVCEGSSFTFPDGHTASNIQINMSHTSHLNNMYGCDSNIQIFLKVKYPVQESYDFTICEGTDFTFPDQTIIQNIKNDTTYLSHLQTVYGCDSIIDTKLQVVKKTYAYLQQKLCYNSSFTLPNGDVIQGVISDTAFMITLKNIQGCDSVIVNYSLTADTLHTALQHIQVCRYADFTFPDGHVISNIEQNQMHVSLLKTAQNCDSIISTNLNIVSIDTSVNHKLLTLEAVAINHSYQWFDCNTGIIVPNENLQTLAGSPGHSYQLILTNLAGCTDSSACHEVHTFSQMDQGKYVHVYPNPVQGFLNMELYQYCASVSIKLLNINGESLFEKKAENIRFMQADLSTLPKGIYVLKVQFNDMTEFLKIVLE